MRVTKFNHGWQYWQETQSFSMAWEIPAYAREVTLPHDPMIEKAVNPASPNGPSSGFRDGGVYAYAKLLHAPMEWKSRTVALHFEGVYMHAMVYVNGQLAAKNPYGYTGFTVALNDCLRYGEENEIRVIARTGAMKNSRWYSGAGIYRDVYLLEGPETHLAYEGVQITTESTDGSIATLRIRTQIRNRRNIPAPLVLSQEIISPDGVTVAAGDTRLHLFGSEERTVQQRIAIDQPQLWDEDHPALYTCITRLYETTSDGSVLLDETKDTFGVRTLQLDAKRGLRVNGKRVELRGTCIHHDSGLLGAATWEDAQWRQVAILKDAGFNAIRMSHHPMAPAMLRACDALGMYVMDEVTDIWTRLKSEYDSGLFFGEWWPRDVEAMIHKDYNHPCVLLYSIGNEIPEIGTPAGAKIAHDMCEKIRSLDATRFTLASINGIFTIGDEMEKVIADVAAQAKLDGKFEGDVNQFMDVMADYHYEIATHDLISQRLEMACAAVDIAGYNYMTSRFGFDGERYPNRVIVGSETFPPDIAGNWRCVKTMPHVIGDFCWTGWDYIGESGAGFPVYEEDDESKLFPSQFSTAGDMEVTGFRKPVSYYRQMVWEKRSEPCIGVQPPWRFGQHLKGNPWQKNDTVSCWTWQGYEGKPVSVEVFAPGDEVELLINGRSYGRKPCGDAADFLAKFEAVYEPGEITAVCYKDGAEFSRETLHTAEGPIGLHLHQEQLPDGRGDELCYIDVSIADEHGRIVADRDVLLHASATGDALLALGTGNPRQEQNYCEPETVTWRGRALAILKRKPGCPVTLTVEAEGMAPVSLTI